MHDNSLLNRSGDRHGHVLLHGDLLAAVGPTRHVGRRKPILRDYAVRGHSDEHLPARGRDRRRQAAAVELRDEGCVDRVSVVDVHEVIVTLHVELAEEQCHTARRRRRNHPRASHVAAVISC